MPILNKNKDQYIQRFLLKWYEKNKRELPWRNIKPNNQANAYYVLVSEFMLQQTTVNTVIKRFNEFIKLWPSIDKLSRISENRILRFWSGLGYYNRAKNLLKTTKITSRDFKSKVPQHYDQLIELPGVGDYTAKAILGIAYNKPVMPLDVNIERILARLYGFQLPLIKIKSELKKKSNAYISKNSSNHLIQAFMDYGSLICTPRNPDCSSCLIKTKCLSYKKNLQNIIPVKIKSNSTKRKKYSRAYILYNEKNEILVRKRSSKGMLASMLEVPNDNWVINKKSLVQDKIALKIKDKMQSKGSVKYSFSHFDLETEVFFTKVKKNIFTNQKWIKKNNINKIGLPTVMKKIIKVTF